MLRGVGDGCCKPAREQIVDLGPPLAAASMPEPKQGFEEFAFRQVYDLVEVVRSECQTASMRQEEMLTRMLGQQLLVKDLIERRDILKLSPATSLTESRRPSKDVKTNVKSGVQISTALDSTDIPKPPIPTECDDSSEPQCGSTGAKVHPTVVIRQRMEVQEIETVITGLSHGTIAYDIQLLRSFIHSQKFDIAMGALICLNIIFMCVELEKKGYAAAVNLQLTEDRGFWANSDVHFQNIDHFFNGAFFFELTLHIAADGAHAFRSVPFLFDFFIVATSIIDYVVTFGVESNGANMNFLRVARLAKLVKLAKTFKAATVFRELRILIKTLINSMMSLVWSVILLFFIMLSGGIFLAQVTAGVIADESKEVELRRWVFEHYGSGSRSFYTLFEATLSGGWPTYARRLIMEVSAWYAGFWLLYVIVVVFAVIRVIGALFLQQTMKMASADEEMMYARKRKEKDDYIARIKKFLQASDKDGNAWMDLAELEAMLSLSDIQEWLTIIGLEVSEIRDLFCVLDDGRAGVKHKDLVENMLRLSGGARVMDTVLLMHGQDRIAHGLEHVHLMLGENMSPE